jgi:hypothetical protein
MAVVTNALPNTVPHPEMVRFEVISVTRQWMLQACFAHLAFAILDGAQSQA